MKKNLLRLFLLILSFFITEELSAQLHVASDHISIGAKQQYQDYGINIYNKNGALFRNNNNWFLIDMRGSSLRFSGSNFYFEFRSYWYSAQGDLVPLFCKDIYYLSDGRLKTDITNLSTPLGRLNALSVQKKCEANQTVQRATTSLQDNADISQTDNAPAFRLTSESLAENFPQLVITDDDGSVSADYIGLIPVLIQALKDTKALIDDQQSQIDALKQKLMSK